MLNVPPIDARCSDPAFAEKYPQACRFFSRLILKNERSKFITGQVVPFRSFVIANGAEVEIASTSGDSCTEEVLFYDDFEAETLGTNYNGYVKWDTTAPTATRTDLVDSSTLGFPGSYAAQGKFVDVRGTNTLFLGGSAADCYIITKDAIPMVAGQYYKLAFMLGGAQRSSLHTQCRIEIGSEFVETFTVPVTDDFGLVERTFIAAATGSSKIKVIGPFQDFATRDLGPVIDEIEFKRICPGGPGGTDVSSGVEFSSSDPAVATIDPITGIATTVAVGKTTISAKWNNQYAYAELEVVEECDSGNYMVLIDNSFSMQQNFDGVYPTKLAFAKFLAGRFFSSMNTTKDQMAFGNFNVEADVNEELTNSIADLNAAWPDLITATERTDLHDAIKHGVEYLNEKVTSGLKILVLITDGQYNRGNLPGPAAREFQQSGGVIIVVGVRVFDIYFQLLNEISTKGYFLSAYSGIAEAVADNLIGLKSFLCSGDCPSGAVFGCLTAPLAAQIADPIPLQVISEH